MENIRTVKAEIGYKFEANGTNYVIEDKLSIARSIMATKMEVGLFKLDTQYIKNTLASAYNDLNGNNKEKIVKFADASVKINNLYSSLNDNIKIEEVPILKYCALHINAENEDRRTITDEQITKKITDWQEGGYDLTGFFLLVLSVLPHVRKDFVKHMEAISQKTEAPEPLPSDTTTSKE